MGTLARTALLALASLAACQRVEPARGVADLRRNLELAPGIELVAPPGPLAERVEAVAQWTLERDVQLSTAGSSRDASRPRVLFGTSDDAELRRLSAGLGVTFGERGFTFEEREFTAPGDALVFTIEDPDRPGMPLTVYLGNDAERLARYVNDLTLCTQPGVRAFRRGRLELEARTGLDGGILRTTVVDRAAEWERVLGEHSRRRTGKSGVVYTSSERLPQERFDAYVGAAEAALAEVLSQFDAQDEALRVHVVLLDRVEDFAALHGRPQQAHVNRVTGDVTVLLEPDVPDDGGAGVALGAALRVAGPAAEPWMESGIALSSRSRAHWWQREWKTYVHMNLVRGRGQEDKALLLEGEFQAVLGSTRPERSSQHRIQVLRTALFEMLLAELPSEEGVSPRIDDLWRGDGVADLTAAEFESWVLGQFVRIPERRWTRPKMPLLGVCLLESERAPHGSDLSCESLSRAAVLGADAVSIQVFASVLPPRPEFAPVDPPAPFEGLTSDVAIASAVADAKRHGMRVLLAPHLLSAPSGSWLGAQVRGSAEDWRAYFAQRTALLVEHYALLAELTEVDVLSLGGELIETTRTAEDLTPWDDPDSESWKREGWERSIAVARRAFDGALVYCAAWPEEAPRIEFWEDLDYVGCNLFGPFLRGPDDTWTPPGDAQVRHATQARVHAMNEWASELRKPLLVTEFGLPSTSLAWRNPRIAEGEIDLATQARVLEAMALGIRDVLWKPVAGNGSPLEGAFLWSWSTDPLAGGAGDAGYTPQNKPAEDALRLLFSEP